MKIKTFFSAAILHTAFLFPQTWNVDANGNWGTAGNWTPATIPNAVDATAVFGNVISADRVVTLDISPTVGTLTFNSTNGFDYQIAPSGSNFLTLNVSSGSAAITVTGDGEHSITAPITLVDNLAISQSSPALFTLAGIISGPFSLTTSGTGAASLSGVNTYTGGTTVTATFLECGVANAIPSSGTVTLSGGALDMNNFNQSIGDLTGSFNVIMGSGQLTVNTSTTMTYSGQMQGTGSLVVAGGGTLILSNTNTFSGGTTVNAGTLQLGVTNALSTTGNLTVTSPGIFNLANFNQTVANLSGSGSINVGSGTLTTNPAAPSTFSGVISGTGSLIKTGASTLVLSGVNTYTGGTTVSAGTLQLGVNNALAPTGLMTLSGGLLDISPTTQQLIGPLSGTSNITMGAAQLTVNSTASSTYSGVMSGTGSLIVAGPQTLTLSNSNTFNGGTTVAGGTLAIGINNALLATGNLAVNSPGIFNLAGFNQIVGVLSGSGSITLGAGTLTVNTPGGMISNFSGVMSQGGALSVGSTGTLILTGANTYSGGTTVAGGATLQGTTTSLEGAITNAGSVIFNQLFSGTFSGTLSGAGSLLINGGGNVTFNTSQTAAATNVTAGDLILLSPAILTSAVTIGPGGALGGTGQVTGVVNNNGTLQLDLSAFTIAGNYNQNVGSFFNVDVTPSSSGLLTVSGGTVTITSPATMDVDVVPGIYPASTLYTLITSSAAPVIGTFSPPVFDNPFFQGTLIYNQGLLPGTVQLLLEIAPFSNVITSGNAGAIAKCINLSAFPTESELLPVINALIFLPVDKVRDALNEMQPSQLKALGLTEENNLVVIRSTISQHADDLNKTECNQAMSELYKWNVWGNFSGDFLRQEGQRQNIGYSADTVGATVGIDGALAKDLFLGIAGAYDYSWLDWSNSRGHGTISSFYVGPYFSWFNHRVFTNVSLLGTFNHYDATRHISFSTIDTHAKSNHNGHGLIAHFDLGVMMYPTAGMTCSPIAGVDYIHLREQGYTEQGAGGLNMKIFSTHASLFRTELGLEIAKCAVLVHNKWTHDLKLSWIHQFPLKGKNLHAQFTEVDCTYTVQGLQPNQDYLDIATGLTGLFMKDKLSAALRYEGKFGAGIRDNTGYIQLTYRF